MMMGWLRKDFSKRGRVPPKNPRRVAGSFLGALSIRMTRRDKDRAPSPAEPQTRPRRS